MASYSSLVHVALAFEEENTFPVLLVSRSGVHFSSVSRGAHITRACGKLRNSSFNLGVHQSCACCALFNTSFCAVRSSIQLRAPTILVTCENYKTERAPTVQ